jgi:hypothetical protein
MTGGFFEARIKEKRRKRNEKKNFDGVPSGNSGDGDGLPRFAVG